MKVTCFSCDTKFEFPTNDTSMAIYLCPNCESDKDVLAKFRNLPHTLIEGRSVKMLIELLDTWKKYYSGCSCDRCKAYLLAAKEMEPIARDIQVYVAALESSKCKAS